jgi:hypothetical protein
MKYTINLMGGQKIAIEEKEFQMVLEAGKGLVFLESIKGLINLSSVVCIIPDNVNEEGKMIERSNYTFEELEKLTKETQQKSDYNWYNNK